MSDLNIEQPKEKYEWMDIVNFLYSYTQPKSYIYFTVVLMIFTGIFWTAFFWIETYTLLILSEVDHKIIETKLRYFIPILLS